MTNYITNGSKMIEELEALFKRFVSGTCRDGWQVVDWLAKKEHGMAPREYK